MKQVYVTPVINIAEWKEENIITGSFEIMLPDPWLE